MALDDYTAEYDDEGLASAEEVSVNPEKNKGKEPSSEEEGNKVDLSLEKEPDQKESPSSKKERPETPAAIEEAARAQGWVDFEEWEGDPAEWRPAEVFVERGQYFETMSKQNKEIKRLNKQLQEQARQVEAIREHEYNRAVEDLKKQRIEAAEEGRYEDVSKLDSEIDETNKQYENERKRAKDMSEKEKQELLDEFISENPWYAKEPEMRAYADRLAAGYAQTDGTDDVYEVLDYVTKEVKSRYKDYFDEGNSSNVAESDYDESGNSSSKNKRQSPSNKVGSSNVASAPNSRSGKNKKASASDLNRTQREIGERWVDVGAIESLDQYAQQLHELGEL